MNDRFYLLPKEKQEKIINAGFQVFSINSYKKSPMSEIADYAGISKSLLFFYFKNKKELYFYLLKKCNEVTVNALKEYGCFNKNDLFEIMYVGLQAKIKIMHDYPYMSRFVIKAFYEKDVSIRDDLVKVISDYSAFKTNASLLKFNKDDFIEGIDLEMMYKEMYLASVGYLWEVEQKGEYDTVKIENDFMKLISYWKNIYLRKDK